MPLFDLPLDYLRTYRTAAVEPPGRWKHSLAAAHEAATPPKEPAAPVLSPADTDFIRRSAHTQQQDAHETMLRAREMARRNEEMRERLRTMDLRIAAQTARRQRSHGTNADPHPPA